MVDKVSSLITHTLRVVLLCDRFAHKKPLKGNSLCHSRVDNNEMDGIVIRFVISLHIYLV